MVERGDSGRSGRTRGGPSRSREGDSDPKKRNRADYDRAAPTTRHWLVALLLLIGCAHEASARPFIGPDGSSDWWHITCHQNYGRCLEKAGQVCLYGYDVEDRARARGVAVASYGGSVEATPTVHDELTIKCKSEER